MENRDHIVEHGGSETGIDADPKDAIHDEIGVGQGPDSAMRNGRVGRLPKQIACEQQPRRDFVRFEVGDQAVTRERRFGSDGERESKPARLRMRGRFREDKELLQIAQAFV